MNESPTKRGADLLTISAAADYLGMSKRFVEYRVADGTIPSLKLRKSRRIRRRDLDEYLARAAR